MFADVAGSPCIQGCSGFSVLSSWPRPWSARWFTADFPSVLTAPKRAKDAASLGGHRFVGVGMSVRLKIEDSRDGLVATISQRNDTGSVIGPPLGLSRRQQRRGARPG